jgi:hypothetical protein
VNLRAIALACVLLGALAGRVLADEDQQAQALLDEGTRQFTEDADYEGARASFEESYRIKPSWKALNGVALTYQEEGRFLDALETYERLLTEFGASLTDAQRATVSKRTAELEKRIGVLAIDARQTGVRIIVDGREQGTGPLAKEVRVLPGAHLVVATLEHHEPYARTIEVGAGKRADVAIDLAPEKVRVVVQHHHARFARRFSRWVPWSVGIGGAAVVLAGGVLTGLASSDFSSFDDRVKQQSGAMPQAVMIDDSLRRRGELERSISIACYAVGGAALAAGVVMEILNQPRYVGEAATPTPTAIVGPGGFMIGVGGRF